jgi:hypothetical protein
LHRFFWLAFRLPYDGMIHSQTTDEHSMPQPRPLNLTREFIQLAGLWICELVVGTLWSAPHFDRTGGLADKA